MSNLLSEYSRREYRLQAYRTQQAIGMSIPQLEALTWVMAHQKCFDCGVSRKELWLKRGGRVDIDHLLAAGYLKAYGKLGSMLRVGKTAMREFGFLFERIEAAE